MTAICVRLCIILARLGHRSIYLLVFPVSAPIHCFWENASGSSNFEEERVGIMSSRQVNVVVAAPTNLKAGEYPSVRSISLMKMLRCGRDVG